MGARLFISKLKPGPDGSAHPPLAVPARTRMDLLLCFLFPYLPDPGPDRAGRNSSRGWLFAGGRAIRGLMEVLVGAEPALDCQRATHAVGSLHRGNDRFPALGVQYLATRNVADLLGVFSLVRKRGTGFFRVPVRRHAARGRIDLPVLCPVGISAALGRTLAAVAAKPFPPAMGMVSHLLRVRTGEASQRRSSMAYPHRDG